MAAGGTGVVTALLLYTLFDGFIPSKVDLDLKRADNRHQLFFYEKFQQYFSSIDLLYKQTNKNAKPSIGHGKHLLAMTLIYPSLYKQIRKKDKFMATMDYCTDHHNLFDIVWRHTSMPRTALHYNRGNAWG